MSATYDTPQNHSEITPAIKWSIFGHILLILFVVAGNIIFPGKPAPYTPTLRVDLVALPDVLKKDLSLPDSTSQLKEEITKALKEAEQEAKKVKAPTPEPKEIAKKDEMVVKPKPQSESKTVIHKNKRALDRIKSLAKLQEGSEKKSNQLVKGNQLSPGTSLSGDARESAEAHYFDLVRDRLQENWSLPTWIARQDFSAQIQIYIDKQGNLRNFKFIKTSGNAQFDDAIKRTLKESQPFAAPPRELQTHLLLDGITVGFPL